MIKQNRKQIVKVPVMRIKFKTVSFLFRLLVLLEHRYKLLVINYPSNMTNIIHNFCQMFSRKGFGLKTAICALLKRRC